MVLHLVETGIIKTGRPKVARPVAELHLSFQVHSSIIFGLGEDGLKSKRLMSVAFCHRKVVKSRFAAAADTIDFQLGFVSKAELQTKIAQLYDVSVEQEVVVWPFCRFE